MSAQRPLELILARNLLSSVAIPGVLFGESGKLLFFNEAAGALLGRSFEDTTGMSLSGWMAEFGPFDAEGRVLAYADLPVREAMAGHRPHHGDYWLRTHTGDLRPVEATAIPIGEDHLAGVIVVFWPSGGAEGQPGGAPGNAVAGDRT